tara:strand:+ start:342 stop:953 length:612 start_codon:yes stop_codon:yes gene_type:complete
MRDLLLQLVLEAKQSNPNSEAARVVDALLHGFDIEIKAEINDCEAYACDTPCFSSADAKGLTQFSNILKAFKDNNALEANKNGLSTSTNFNEHLDLSVALTFKAKTNYQSNLGESIHTYSIDSDSIPGDTDEEKKQHAYKTLIGDVTKRNNPELGGVTAFVDCEDVNVYAEDTIIDLRGMKYATKAIIQTAISKHGYKKSTNI